MSQDYFYEDQRFNQWWMWLLMGSGCLVFVGMAMMATYVQFIEGKPFGDKPMTDTGLVLFGVSSVVLTAGTVALFRSMRLETRVDRFGVSYRFSPFIRKWHIHYREEITHWEITRHFTCGHGMHVGLKSRTISIRGRYKLALTLSSGKKLYLGTQLPEKFRQAMVRLYDRQPEL